jgi:zinc D-Ala-D-Ala carboxypeptidase
MLIPTEYRLINGPQLDAVPAGLYRARSNAHARQLTQADWLIRDRRDGRYVATLQDGNMRFFQRHAYPQGMLEAVIDTLANSNASPSHLSSTHHTALLHELGVDADDYSRARGLSVITEPVQLEYAGRDCYQRPLWLDYDAGKAWKRLHTKAATEDIALQAISGYRSMYYQLGIFRRKQARGIALADILAVNAAPGFSEHHSGRAIDIATAGVAPAEESFEHTPAYAWLEKHAHTFGFRMSYPRDNPHGIAYEPWHWYWVGSDHC